MTKYVQRQIDVSGHKRYDPRVGQKVDVNEYKRNQKVKKYKKTNIKKQEILGKSPQTSLSVFIKKDSVIAQKLVEKLTQTKAYKRWLELEEELDKLSKKADKTDTFEEKKKLNDKIEKNRREANKLYEAFRFIVRDQIVKEDKAWVDEFLNGLRESHRYKYRKVEDLKDKELEKIPNPFFDNIFKYARGKFSSPVIIELSKDGNNAILKFDNMRPDGNGFKAPQYSYNIFSRILRSNYDARWDSAKESFVIQINDLDDALKKLKDEDVYLNYHIKDVKNNDEKSWRSRSNVPKMIVEKTENLILEVEGSKVRIKGEDANIEFTAKMDINTEFSRERMKGGQKKKYPAAEQGRDGKYYFNVGLLDEAYWYLEGLGYHPAIADDRPRKIITSPEIKGINLWDFQKKAI